jgi:tRNA G18 (ribose-2'-O)-methylase SpoU
LPLTVSPGHDRAVSDRYVEDPDDPRLAEFVGLRDHELRRRREGPHGDLHGIFIAEGDQLAERALQAGYVPRAVLIDDTRTAPLPDSLPADVPVFRAGPAVMLRITGYHLHRGMLASFDRRPVPPADEVLAGRRRAVVLEGVANPTNLGVVVRSANALGMDALLLDPSCCDPLYRRASRVSMGQVFAMPYAHLDALPDGLAPLRRQGFTIVALTPEASAEPVDELRFAHDKPVALLLGTEGAGLSDPSLAVADRRVRIPMQGQADSLNVGVAAAIAFYELGAKR